MSGVLRLKADLYIHVLDENTNTVRLVQGPQTYTRKQNETIVSEPKKMILVPPRHYCVIRNPVLRKDNKIILDEFQQAKLKWGDTEIRFESTEPFPLYPGEELSGKIQELINLPVAQALRLRANRDFKEIIKKKEVPRSAGDEWYFFGPNTYYPRIEVDVIETVKSTVIKPNTALKIKARRNFVDRKGIQRRAGEVWLVREEGDYLPDVDEIIAGSVRAFVLTDKKALHLRATKSFKDYLNIDRKAGEEWLVTLDMTETYIPDVYEEVVGQVSKITLTTLQYCVILDPFDENNKQRIGHKELRKGECSFFLKPGEKLEKGIQSIYVLAWEEALLLRCIQPFRDETEKKDRIPGETWLVKGPIRFIPPNEVDVIEKRKSIPLDENEGIYVRDLETGNIRSVIGKTHMLEANEELWKKPLPQANQKLSVNRAKAIRDPTRVITYRVPHNSAVQIYNYQNKTSRVAFGPDLVMLDPDEQFTVLSLSGSVPKRPNVIRTISLSLGPDFMTDVLVVETSDHARLSLQLSYNWHFEVDPKNPNDAKKIFQIPDFIGAACKAIGANIRGVVARTKFDDFHKKSADIIRDAVFGRDDSEKPNPTYRFETNNLVITNIDIQSVEPVDKNTLASLQKSVQLAISITTQSQEADAKQDALRREAQAKARLERQEIDDQIKAEEKRKKLLELRAESAAVKSMGTAKAEAKAKAEAAMIEGRAKVKQAELKLQAAEIKTKTEIENMKSQFKLEFEQQKKMNQLKIAKTKKMADIEINKFKEIVSSIGKDTIKAISQAGPEVQRQLLSGLGIEEYFLDPEKSPLALLGLTEKK
ncbi:major vault protein [Anaeramoeba ignava]|uniref:Major vault protein n=1 Tax=Anaeramoeba ignava TaxID=1746090 RepID=A0A9Q0LFY9_ANAIG|nr:major vault protein [Anaeramoeba ignava]